MKAFCSVSQWYRLLPLCALVLVVLLTTPVAHSQIGQTAIVYSDADYGIEATVELSGNGTEIDGWVSVDFESYLDDSPPGGDEYLGGVRAEAKLFDQGSLVDDSGWNEGATADATAATNVGDSYTLAGLAEACWMPDYDSGDGGTCDWEPAGSLQVSLQTGAPSIASISPVSAIVGAQPTPITVRGENLVDAFGDSSVSITGGVNASIGSGESATQATVNYSTLTNSNAGRQTLTISNSFGKSNGETFTVGYPTPTIASISPTTTWYAGSSYTITITGNNFGTAPTVSIALPSGSIQPATSNPSDTSVTVSFAVPVNCASGEAPVTVTSTGFNGSGFYPGSSGNSPSASYDAPQAVAQTPVPQIMFNGGNISGTTQAVQPGQQIALSVPAPAGYAIQNQSWLFSNETAITGGFVNGAGTIGTQPSAAAGGSEAADPPLNQELLTFYWVNPEDNGETITYTYTLDNGQSKSAVATFNIGGPTGVLLPNTLAQENNSATVLSNALATPVTMTMTNAPGFPQYGVSFSDLAALPGGKFIWVQILNSVTRSELVPLGGAADPSNNALNQLDGIYPYPVLSPTRTEDSPNMVFSGGLGEASIAFDATMYVLWDPALPAGCIPAWSDNTKPFYTPHPSTCSSIPVPLGSVQWTWSACAINSGVAVSPSWFIQCGPAAINNATTSGYPEWTRCFSSANANCQ